MGQTGGFVDCTTLDTAKQFISDLPEGAEKSIGFIDDPSNADFAALLNAADKRNGTVLRRAAERPHFHLHPVAVRLENE